MKPNSFALPLVLGAILVSLACSNTTDSETTGDDGTSDAGTADAGTGDAGTPDAGTPDAGTPDAGTPDAGTPDAGTPDGGSTTTCTSKFSFFVTSQESLMALALQTNSTNTKGFGGNFAQYGGFSGNGAGLKGADKICADIAEISDPGNNGCKTWRAFLSVSKGENGTQVNAIDRVGDGPWYDRKGNLVASSKANLVKARPNGCSGNTGICMDLPNEFGVLNHSPDGRTVDNHDMLTGSTDSGTLYSGGTCNDWTSNATNAGKPMCGHSWPRQSGDTSDSWINAHSANGCAAGVNTTNSMGGQATVGAMGGYGGFYCFAILH